MIVYAATKQQFLKDNDNDDIEEVILRHFKEATGKKVGASEIRSWQGSLTYMAKVLRDDDLPSDAGLAIELHIPQSSKRIDFCSRDAMRTKQKSCIDRTEAMEQGERNHQGRNCQNRLRWRSR